MKTLYLLRHASAVKGTEALPDFDRPLTKGGRRETELIAARFRKKIDKPEIVISSPARRALDTAAIFYQTIGGKKKNIAREPDIYEQAPGALLKLIKGLDDQFSTAALVGHNPSFEELCSDLMKDFERSVPKAAIVGIQFKTDAWKNIRRGQGVQCYLDYPGRKAERAAGRKQERQEVVSKLESAIHELLNGMNPGISEAITETIRRNSKKIAKDFVKAREKMSR